MSMDALPAIPVAVTMACLAPALRLGARALVPARIGWKACVGASSLFAGLLVPAIAAHASGYRSTWWLLAAMGAFPYLASFYLAKRALAIDGQPLGRPAAGELCIHAVCISVTAGVAAWGLL